MTIEEAADTVLVVYESKYGQSETIAERIGELAERRGWSARVLSVAAARYVAVDEYRAVVIVAPVYFGRAPGAIRRFARDHADLLAKSSLAVVSVSGSAMSQRAEDQARARQYASDFVKEARLKPNRVLTVGGAVAYPRYPYLTRLMMRAIHRRSGHDPRKVNFGTNWRQLESGLADLFSPMRRSTKAVHATVETLPV